MTAKEGKKGFLERLRKHGRAFTAVGLLTTLIGCCGTGKGSTEKVDSSRMEQIVQTDVLAEMPTHYTDRFQALDDEYILETAWKMIMSKDDLKKAQYETEYWLASYNDLSEYDRHMLYLDEEALRLSLKTLKQLPSGPARKGALQDLREEFEKRLMHACSGHGLLEGVSTGQGYVNWGDSKFAIGIMNSGKAANPSFSAEVLRRMYQNCDDQGGANKIAMFAKRDAYLTQVSQEITGANSAYQLARGAGEQRG